MKGIFVVALALCVIAVFVDQAEAKPEPFVSQFLSPFFSASQMTQVIAFFTKLGELFVSLFTGQITPQQFYEQGMAQWNALMG